MLNKLLFIILLSSALAFSSSNPALMHLAVYEQWCFDKDHYISTNAGLVKIQNEDSLSFIFKTGTDRIMDMAVHEGQLGLVTYNGKAYQFSNGVLETIGIPKQKNGEPYVLNGIIYTSECWWISALEGVVFQVKEKGVINSYSLSYPRSRSSLNINSIGLDNDENIWVSSIDRIYFLTGIHKRRKKKFDFLASSEFEFEASYLFSSNQGVFVLSKAQTGDNILSLGTLKSSVMDALRKEIHLPEAISNSQNLIVSANGAHLHILSGDELFTFSDFDWSSQKVAINYPDANSIAISGNLLWIGGPQGLKKVNLARSH